MTCSWIRSMGQKKKKACCTRYKQQKHIYTHVKCSSHANKRLQWQRRDGILTLVAVDRVKRSRKEKNNGRALTDERTKCAFALFLEFLVSACGRPKQYKSHTLGNRLTQIEREQSKMLLRVLLLLLCCYYYCYCCLLFDYIMKSAMRCVFLVDISFFLTVMLDPTYKDDKIAIIMIFLHHHHHLMFAVCV